MVVVFDWDGTLVNSTAKIVSAMQQAARNESIEVLGDLPIQQIIGLGLPEAMKVLYPHSTQADCLRMQQAYKDAFVTIDNAEACALFEGVEYCLAELEARNIRIAVATGKSRKGLDRMLKTYGWSDRFHATRCADETVSKPHPKMLQELSAELNVSPADMFMVGDTTFDLEMAKNAGIRSVGVSYGAHRVSQLEVFSPIAIVDCLRKLPALVA
ncbi:MAG: HAD-IA family hydrolase [Sinobacterium sp.]|nr:HAD-IA family hydrolase [Sinobacterium sp.]